MEKASDQTILRAPLHTFGPKDWAIWYPRVAQLIEADDPDKRAAAVQRLSTAVFRAEDRPSRQGPSEDTRQRLDWLTGMVEKAMYRHPDVLTAFLKQLCYQGDAPEFSGGLLTWLDGLKAQHIPGVPKERIEGVVILIGGIAPWSGSVLPSILDHSSDYVRACAARVLGSTGQGFDEDEGIVDHAFFAALTEKELERPGIAGPYWSGTGLMYSDRDELGFDVVDWMLGMIERRRGPEPEDMPFNGIDFHIHELAAGNPQAVRRMIAANRLDLAVMTATEIRSRIDAMIPVLSELSTHDDRRFAVQAQIHLAHFYGVLHPLADPQNIRFLENWRDGARTFVIRYGHPARGSGQLVIFPKQEAGFSDSEAAAIIDGAISPDLRGELQRHYLATHDAEPAAYRLGSDELRSYASGTNVTLTGSANRPTWQRIDISAGRLADRWDPWSW